MTNNEIWYNSFKNFIGYINFYHMVPTGKIKEYSWIRSQIYAHQQGKLRNDRYIILNEMAPGIFVDGISKAIKSAIENGTKYIEKYAVLNAKPGIDSNTLDMYRDTLSNFGLSSFNDLFALLIKESLCVKSSKPSLAEIYSAVGLSRSEVEDARSIASNNTSNIISYLYWYNIKSKIGFGTIELMNRLIGTVDLRELIRASMIFRIIEDLAFAQISPKQALTIRKAVIGNVPVRELSKQECLTSSVLYERIRRGIMLIGHRYRPILTGKNLSQIEKFYPTQEQEAKIFKLLYNSIEIPNKTDRKPDLLVLFRLGFIGELGEPDQSIESKLAKLDILYVTVPELRQLREPKNLDMVTKIDVVGALSNSGSKSEWPKVILPADSIEVLKLSNRAYNVLIRAGVTSVGELRAAAKDTDRMLKFRGMGVGTLSEILTKLNEVGR